jgi:hypothetical protein
MVIMSNCSARRRLTQALVLLLVAGTACTFPEKQIAPGEKHLVIHAVLNLGAQDQRILVDYSDVGDSITGSVLGALVSITTPEGVRMVGIQDSVALYYDTTRRVPAGGYRISPEAYGVTLMPGAKYRLDVHTPAGEDATGTTTIPQATAVATPTVGELFRWARDTLRLSWPAVPGAQSYQVEVVSTFVGSQDGFQSPQSQRYLAFHSHQLTLAGSARQPLDGGYIFVRSSHTTVSVFAVDINYYHYYRVLSDPLSGAAPSHLIGALGVFGSIVPIVARRLDVR